MTVKAPIHNNVARAAEVAEYIERQLEQQFLRYIQKADLIRLSDADYDALRVTEPISHNGFKYNGEHRRYEFLGIPVERTDTDKPQFFAEMRHFG